MDLQVVPNPEADHRRKQTKVTCVTCQFKKCVGRCQWTKGPSKRAA